MSDDDFCAECGVTLDLHTGPIDDFDEEACEVARMKADLIDRFWKLADVTP